MPAFILTLANAIIGRLYNSSNPESRTQVATASSVPTATAAALMLMQDGDPVMQFIGGVLAIASALLVLYKDGNDINE